jgi:hypothetical protein
MKQSRTVILKLSANTWGGYRGRIGSGFLTGPGARQAVGMIS